MIKTIRPSAIGLPDLRGCLTTSSWRPVAIAATLACTLSLGAAAPPVRVWQDTLELPTYMEGPANVNAPFDLFSFGRFNYPYPIRDALTDRRERVKWRSLNMENEYLRLTVLPDLGGHVYSCLDKRTGREMFYANSSIKKALIGYRGAWAAFGVEFNFPVSHNWMSMSPVDFSTAQHDDGSASIWIGNVDQVYRSQWRVELEMRPGRPVLEQHVELYNRSDVRHRYYWWTNGAVQAWEDSHLVYPTELMATHGFTSVEPWPIDRKGRDLSIIHNQVDGPVSLFTYRTREGFVGVYHPHTSSGTVHLADPAVVPYHKVWSWGYDRDAAAWREALSDDDSGYVELQAGLFRNQETYGFLEPQESVRFTEYWLPVRDLGGITRANLDAVLHVERVPPARARVALDVTRDLPDAHITVRQGQRRAVDARVSLSPREAWRTELNDASPDPVIVELTDASGRTLLAHTENVFNRTPASAVRLGPTRENGGSAPDRTSVSALVEAGLTDELEGRRLQAMSRYAAALRNGPQDLALLKSAGRLAVALGWADSDGAGTKSAIEWLEAAHARNTTDAEVEYYLGLALAAGGRGKDARPHLEAARRFRATRTQATLELARVLARDGDLAMASALMQTAAAEAPRASLAGALEVALLRRQAGDRNAELRAQAVERARSWQKIDPTSSLLRFEMTLLGQSDSTLWLHLGADANRVLDLVDQYLSIGAYDEALALLEQRYPAVASPMREPGAVAPDASPLVAYYRGYVKQQLGRAGDADFRMASALSTAYVFPARRSSYAVLEAALKADPQDATARFLLGSLHLSSGRVDEAIEQWQRARRARPAVPTLHRNLAMALLYGSGAFAAARAVLEEGTAADPANVEIYLTLDGVLSAANVPPRERVAALRRFPAPDQMPAPIVYDLAQALAEAGEASEAERLFHGRFFPREEGGTSVRSVYTEVRLTSARAAADGGRCSEAREILDSLGREQQDLAFTAGGLAGALDAPLMSRQAAAVEWTCGRREQARARWQRLERGLARDAAPVMVAIGDEARTRLGRARTADERRRLEEALDGATRTIESGAGGNPGLVEYARASLLSALGRTDEARRSRARVFVLPDRNLSHALARMTLGREQPRPDR